MTKPVATARAGIVTPSPSEARWSAAGRNPGRPEPDACRPRNSAVAGAVGWLRRHQKPDGGWGEHYTSCLTGHYVEHSDSQAAMTAWALLALLRAAGPADPSARRAVACLVNLRRQGTGGGWPQQAASGIFFQTAVLDYRLYKDIFPVWALALTAGQPGT